MTGIGEVARAAGVSTATVSRAVRGLPSVRPETRARVLEAADRLGYHPSRAASSLATGRLRAVSVVVPYVTRWYFASVVSGAEGLLSSEGYDLLLHNLGGDAAARHRALGAGLLARQADATLVLGLRLSEEERQLAASAARPLALVGTTAPGVASVGIDDQEAACVAVRHLLSLGHRRVAFVGSDDSVALEFEVPRLRQAGWAAALEEAGLAPDPALQVSAGFGPASARSAVHELLASPRRPTAVFAAWDELAFGVLQAARDLGLRVPEDLSVAGVDDHDMAELLGLTTVRQDTFALGRTAANHLLSELHGEDPQPGSVVLPTSLVVRTSTAPPCPA